MYCIANREGMYSLTKGGERIQLSLKEIQKTLCSMATYNFHGTQAAESHILRQSRVKLAEFDQVREKLAVAEERIKELEGKVTNDGARAETHTSSASENSDSQSLDHWYWLVPKKDASEFEFVELNYEQKMSMRNSRILPMGLVDKEKWSDDVGIYAMNQEEVRRSLEDMKGTGGLWFGEK